MDNAKDALKKAERDLTSLGKEEKIGTIGDTVASVLGNIFSGGARRRPKRRTRRKNKKSRRTKRKY